MTLALGAAAVYNLTWSAWAGLCPGESFAASGLAQPDRPLTYPQLWQALAGLVGVFGLGYAVAATNPVRHWGLVLIGLVSKLLGGLGTTFAVGSGTAQPVALLWAVFNDFAWWVPFALILRHAYHQPEPRP